MTLPRIEYAVPHLLHVHLEIGKAIHTLETRGVGDQSERSAVAQSTTDGIAELAKRIARDAVAELHKVGVDPNQPRVPAGNPDGGQWTSEGGNADADDPRALPGATSDNNRVPGARYAANELHGSYPPLPPGYDPKTWKQGQWPNGRYWLEDPEGNKYTVHPEDDGHWRHWDKQDRDGNDQGRWPPNSLKPRPGQKSLNDNQSPSDPSGNAPPWSPSPYVPDFPIEPVPIPEFPAPLILVPE